MPKTTPTPRVPTFPPADCTEPSPSIVNASEAEEAIAPAEKEEEKAPIIARHVLSSNMGLTIVGDPDFNVWEEIVATYSHVFDKSSWWVGDAIAYGEAKFGEKYAQAIKISGRKLGTLMNIVSVCQRVQISRRREKLSFKHHSLIAGLHYQTGDELLAQAEREHWNTDDMEKEVKRRKALADGVDPSEPTRKPGSTAAKVAASGKTPQVPENHSETINALSNAGLLKALVWNGYPLRVMLMPNSPRSRAILQGDEFLTTEEADRAAHHHKFAHGPALAAWLEEHNFIKGGESQCATPTPSADSLSNPASVLTSEDAGSLPTIDAQSMVASNGAAPNATESAPTPQEGQSPANEKFIDTPLLAAKRQAFDYPNQENLDELIRQAQNAVNVAPEAPPASPEPTSLFDALCVICGQPITPYDCYGVGAGIGHRYHWDCVRKEAATVGDGQPPAGQTATSTPHTPQTPLQRAEEAILRFNEASKAVDWAEVGRNALRRQRWLSQLLIVADQTIDTIQNNPPTPRK